MRSKGNPYHMLKCLPRMSWSPENLWNLHQRSGTGPKAREIQFTSPRITLFQQRFLAKKLVRAYHGDHIREKQFKKWYLPDIIPDVRPNEESWSEELGEKNDSKKDRALFSHYIGRKELLKAHEEKLEHRGMPPTGSLVLKEVERRIDVVIFRACFAPTIWEARRLVVHGHVLLNGKVHRNSNTRLAPNDMVTVHPRAIRFLSEPTTQEDRDLYQRHKSWQQSMDRRKANPDPTIDDPNEPPYSWDHPLDRAQAEGSQSEQEVQRLFQAAQLTAPIRGFRSSPISKLEVGEVPTQLTPFRLPFYASPWLFIPPYLEVSFNTCSVVYVRHPSAGPGYSEIPTPYDADGEIIRSVWDWYSYRKPRISTQRKRSRMPHDRVYDTPDPSMPHDKDFRGLRKSKAEKKWNEVNKTLLQKIWRIHTRRNLGHSMARAARILRRSLDRKSLSPENVRHLERIIDPQGIKILKQALPVQKPSPKEPRSDTSVTADWRKAYGRSGTQIGGGPQTPNSPKSDQGPKESLKDIRTRIDTSERGD